MSLARQTTRWHVARWGTLGWIETGVKSLAFLCASKLVDARTPLWCGTCQQVSTPGFLHNQAISRCMELSGFEPLTSWALSFAPLTGSRAVAASIAATLIQASPGSHPGGHETYGAKRIRTADLLGAIQALSQLSYSPANAQYIGRQAGSEPGRTGAWAAPSCVRSTRISGSAGASRRTRDSTNAAGIHSSVLLAR